MEMNNFYKRKGYCQSLLDTPCRSTEDAREIEKLLDAGAQFKRLEIVSDIETKEAGETETHTAVLTASTRDVDRDGESVEIKGIDLKHYKQNPLICWQHDYSKPPIGRALWTKVEDDKLKSKVQFALKPADWGDSLEWFPDTIFALAQQKILKGVSIGFLALEASSPTEKELRANPELASCKSVIRKSRLLEISIVGIPCNQNCLIEETKSLPDFWVWESSDFLPEVKATPQVDSRVEFLKQLESKLRNR